MLAAKGLAAGLRRMIALPGQEAPADPVADLRTEIVLADPGADFLLPPVRLDGEAPHGLLSELDAAAAETGLTVANPAADARALKAAAKTRLKMRITGRNDGLRHETPPCASSTPGGNCLLLFPPVSLPCRSG